LSHDLKVDRITAAFGELAANDAARADFLLENAEALRSRRELTEHEVEVLKRLLPHVDRALARVAAAGEVRNQSSASLASSGSYATPAAEAASDVGDARHFINGSFSQLRAAFVLTLTMSSIAFCIGIVFLVIAGYGVATGTSGPEETAVVGGIGLAQIVALFFTRPLQTVERAVANAQQARLIIMTYMIQVGLLGERVHNRRGSIEDAEALQQYTDKAVSSLEHYIESDKGSVE
jgi:hypothetical protein